MNPQDMVIPQNTLDPQNVVPQQMMPQEQIGKYIQAKLAQLQQIPEDGIGTEEPQSQALDKFIVSKGLQPGNVTYIPKSVPKMDGSGNGRGCGKIVIGDVPPMLGGFGV